MRAEANGEEDVMATGAELLHRAERAEADGQWIDAATLYERAGDVDRAIAAYTRGGGADRAAFLLEGTGRAPQAAALLVSTGQYLKAAAVYEKAKDFRKAASALLRGNQRERAAAMFERAEAFEDAAKVYASLGNHLRAIQLYEAAGNADKAQELRAAHGAEAAAADEVLELDPSMEVAADQYLDSGALVGGLVALLRKGRAEEAARIYAACQEDIGYAVIAAVAGDRALETAAAGMFQAAKDFGKAGQVFESLEAWAEAGAMYAQADDAYMAAEMFVRAGDRLRAAESFEKNGSWQQAAELYLQVEAWDKAAANFERSVNHFLAGKLYFRMQRMDKSLQLLQKVQKSEAQYFEACRMIGQILAAHGHLDLAIRKYLEVVQSAEPSKETAAVFYDLGRVLEKRGNAAQALHVYERLLGWDFSFEDVAARVKAIRAGGPPSPPAGGAPRAAADAPAAPSSPASAAPARPGRETQLVAMMDGFEFLKGTPLFRELSLDEMKAVYQACEMRRYPPGAVLVEQDRPGEALLVLRKGSARVVKQSGAEEQLVARMGPGSPAGEMSLVDDAPTSARVVAETEVEVFCITRERFDKILRLNDRIAVKLYRFFVQTLAKRLRATSDRLTARA